MARPTKVGLDYFPLDVHADDKMELLEAEHGLEGFAILIKLYQRIYNNGYCCDWNEDTCMLFAKKINTEQTLVSSVVNTCLRRRLFDKGMYELHGVLTSKGIQTRFLTICKSAKRKGFKVADQHCLLVNPEETPVNPEETPSKPPLTPSESTQSKVKESKVNKSKGDKKGLCKPSFVPFETWYSQYPKKKDRAKAEKKWEKMKVTPELLATMLSSLREQKVSEEWTKERGKYIPYATTYLNGRRWEDEVTAVAVPSSQNLCPKCFHAKSGRCEKEKNQYECTGYLPM